MFAALIPEEGGPLVDDERAEQYTGGALWHAYAKAGSTVRRVGGWRARWGAGSRRRGWAGVGWGGWGAQGRREGWARGLCPSLSPLFFLASCPPFQPTLVVLPTLTQSISMWDGKLYYMEACADLAAVKAALGPAHIHPSYLESVVLQVRQEGGRGTLLLLAAHTTEGEGSWAPGSCAGRGPRRRKGEREQPAAPSARLCLLSPPRFNARTTAPISCPAPRFSTLAGRQRRRVGARPVCRLPPTHHGPGRPAKAKPQRAHISALARLVQEEAMASPQLVLAAAPPSPDADMQE